MKFSSVHFFEPNICALDGICIRHAKNWAHSYNFLLVLSEKPGILFRSAPNGTISAIILVHLTTLSQNLTSRAFSASLKSILNSQIEFSPFDLCGLRTIFL